MPNDIGNLANQPISAVGRQHLAVAESEELDLRQVLDLIFSNKWPILGLTLLCILFGALYTVIATPVYKADGLVQVESDSKAGSTAGSVNELNSMLFSGTVATQAEIEILKSRMILNDVIDKMNLLIDVRPKVFPIIGPALARWRQDRVEPVSPPPFMQSFAWGGERIEVSTFQVPEGAVGQIFSLVTSSSGYELLDSEENKILDGKVGEMANVDLPQGQLAIFVRALKARPGTIFFVSQRARQDVIASLSSKLKIAEQGKQSGVIRISFSGSSPQKTTEVINNIEDAYVRQNVERHSAEAQQSLEFLETQLPDLRKKVEIAQTALNVYQLRHGTVDVTEETSQVLKESVDLETRRLQLLQQREEGLQKFTPEHPTIKALDDQIKVIEQAQGRTKSSVEKLPTTQQDVLSLMRDLNVSTQLYTTMLDTVQQLQVAKAGTVGDVRLVDRALKPVRRSSPEAILVIPGSLLVGLFLGCAYIITRRALLPGIDDPAIIESRFGLVTLAAIPYSVAQRRLTAEMKKGRDSGGTYILATSKDDDRVSEALRSLRTALHFVMLDAPNNVLMITGPSPGLGKSFVTANLAAVLAISGKKVLLIDADLRRGHLHRYFGVSESPGLTDFVAGSADNSSIIRTSAISGLDYISRGPVPPNPGELLLHNRFAEFIKNVSRNYDHVVIDSPPVLPVADALVLARLAGCTFLALKSAEHPIREIDESLKRFTNSGLSIRGVIFNQVGARVGSYGYGNYGYGYYKYKY